ncbi:hypothetical protein CDEST_00074 [Colletotrichum destructivum]|uniref:Uncharacterized protein n=1 Tax=Colletotrichum destructivum TaxID=34406 RepID=A0AAX4HW29_9PEZI|nr:hypothetical protein CDEST_00074 [Colletotrichum destructivum]
MSEMTGGRQGGQDANGRLPTCCGSPSIHNGSEIRIGTDVCKANGRKDVVSPWGVVTSWVANCLRCGRMRQRGAGWRGDFQGSGAWTINDTELSLNET